MAAIQRILLRMNSWMSAKQTFDEAPLLIINLCSF
jgi:hypothetical protein